MEEFLYPVVLWRELAAFAIVVVVLTPSVAFVCRHVHFKSRDYRYAFGSALLCVGTVVIARVIEAPVIGIGFGLVFIFAIAYYFPVMPNGGDRQSLRKTTAH